MKRSLLKPARLIISLLFLLAISVMFLDFRNFVSPKFIETFTFLQFVPSLLNFSILSFGFLIVIAITLLFGRIYCSTICPLGSFQDVLSFRNRNRYTFAKPHNTLRYGILALTVIVFVFGSSLVLNLLDPFSSFGRIFSNLFRPVVIALNNFTAPLLESKGVLLLYSVRWGEPVVFSILFASAVLMLVFWLSVRHGRLYCNTLCPVGALLGLVSKVSVFRIAFGDHACTHCGECAKVCKSRCIDVEEKEIDMSRCVSCFNCFDACDRSGINYELRKSRSERKPVEKSRRKFMVNTALFSTVVLPGAEIPLKQVKLGKPTTVPVVLTSQISPPGSVSISHFTSKCTACHLCVSACPTRVLVPSITEFGLHGLLQPHMGFNRGHCNYECTVCIDLCPTGAIKPIDVEEKKLTQVGIAKFIKDNCVVHTDKLACGACSEHCPTKAVKMIPYENEVNDKLTIPEMNKDICVGCGGCEYACPTKPFKAIYVDGNPVHKQAKKPEVEKLEPVNLEEDFPF